MTGEFARRDSRKKRLDRPPTAEFLKLRFFRVSIRPVVDDQPKRSAETWRGDLYTLGDMGYLDEDGYLFITDRMKDMIISGGMNIYPREIEEVLNQHPSVFECSVLGVPDPKWGEAVKAVVVLREGMAASEEELIEHCKQRLASFKKPSSVDFIDELPKSGYGKILKRELRDRYWQGHGRSRIV